MKPFDRHGAPANTHEILRILKNRSAKLYIFVLVLVLLMLFSVGIYLNWPCGDEHFALKFLTSCGSVIAGSYMNFFSTLFGMLISIAVARFVFGDTPYENTALEAGILRATQNVDPEGLTNEIYENIGKVGAGEVIISDNWLWSQNEHVNPVLLTEVRKAIERGARISVIMMHPGSPLAHRRELVVAKVRQHIVTNIRTSIVELQRIYRSCVEHGSFQKRCGSLSVYCADSYLALCTYVTPSVSHLGFYGAKNTSILGPQFLVATSSMVGTSMREYAEAARNVGEKAQALKSYKNARLRYGTQINLAAFDPADFPDKLSPEKEEQIAEDKVHWMSEGAVSIEDLFNQVLDSQAVDFFNVLSKEGADETLAAFLSKYPGSLEGRKSKDELIGVVENLLDKLKI